MKRVTFVGRALADMFGGLEKIIKVASAAMLVFTGTTILSGMGLMATGIIGIGRAFEFAQIKALFFWLSSFAGFAIIGLGIVLAIQDILTFFDKASKASDSILGQLMLLITDWWKGLREVVSREWDHLWGEMQFAMALAMVGMMKKWEKIKNFAKGIITSIRDFINSMIGNTLMKTISLFINPFADKLKASVDIENMDAAMKTVTMSTPQSSPVPGQVTQNVTVSPNIKIEVPPGTPPEIIGSAIAEGMDNALSKMLREASRATRPREAY